MWFLHTLVFTPYRWEVISSKFQYVEDVRRFGEILSWGRPLMDGWTIVVSDFEDLILIALNSHYVSFEDLKRHTHRYMLLQTSIPSTSLVLFCNESRLWSHTGLWFFLFSLMYAHHWQTIAIEECVMAWCWPIHVFDRGTTTAQCCRNRIPKTMLGIPGKGGFNSTHT